MVRLVAVAVDEDDVAWRDQRLRDDLVGGRGSVGDEVGLPGAEGLGRQLLGLAQRAGRLEQRIEPAGGRRGLGQEDVQTVEAHHVADPVRVDDRLALRDRQRVEHSGRPLAVRAEGLEERRTVALGDAGEDRQVQLECALACMEDPAEVMADLSCDILDRYFAHQVQIDLGPDLGQAGCQDLRPLVRGMVGKIIRQRCVGEVGESAELTHGRVRKASPDHARLDVRVEPHGDGGLNATSHDDEVINEGISGATPAADLFAELLLLCGRHGLNNEDLEIWPAECIMRYAEDHLLAVGSMFGIRDIVERTRTGMTR